MGKYTPNDKYISRREAWEDIKDYPRRLVQERRPVHATTGLVVDLLRLAGVGNAEVSRRLGRAITVSFGLVGIYWLLGRVSQWMS